MLVSRVWIVKSSEATVVAAADGVSLFFSSTGISCCHRAHSGRNDSTASFNSVKYGLYFEGRWQTQHKFS